MGKETIADENLYMPHKLDRPQLERFAVFVLTLFERKNDDSFVFYLECYNTESSFDDRLSDQ
jgi:hypothetical protein